MSAAAPIVSPAANEGATASATATIKIAYPPLPPVFKHEHPIANPPKGVFGTLLRSTGLAAENRLVLKPTQLALDRYEELGYDGVFGRYYRLADTFMTGEKGAFSFSTGAAFRLTGAVRRLFFEIIKRALLSKELIPVDFEEVVRTSYEQIRRMPALDESLRSELLLFLDILDLRYGIEISNARRSVREMAARAAGKATRVGVVGGTRRRHRPRRHTRRIR
jgi:hypothetical protein